MFKFKKGSTNVVLYCVIVIFVIFVFYFIYKNIYNKDEYNHIESFSLKKTFHSQKRNFKNWNKKHVSKHTSKIGRFFKSMF